MGQQRMVPSFRGGECFAYFNNPKDCIIVTLKSGKKYILACDNPNQMVEDIQKKIENFK